MSNPLARTAQAYEQLIARFVRWAQSEENIRAAVVIGSLVRTDHPADEWADLDVIIVASDPTPYLSSPDWVATLGNPWLTFLEPTADGRNMERRVLYEGGLDVDFAMVPLDLVLRLEREGFPPETLDGFRRGARFLVDKDNLKRILALVPSTTPKTQPPSQTEFNENVNNFWYHAVWTAKHLRRGELWWAKGGSDGHLKSLLRQMLEWHARALKGPGHDTWLRGRFLEEWADPRAVKELRSCFAHYEREDIWKALLATMDLFRWVAKETAVKSGCAYHTLGDERTTELVRKLFEGRH